jgi:hypothetical protein
MNFTRTIYPFCLLTMARPVRSRFDHLALLCQTKAREKTSILIYEYLRIISFLRTCAVLDSSCIHHSFVLFSPSLFMSKRSLCQSIMALQRYFLFFFSFALNGYYTSDSLIGSIEFHSETSLFFLRI